MSLLIQAPSDSQLDMIRQRFEALFTRGPGCWTWDGSVSPSGYGRFQTGRRTARGHWSPDQAHRVSYELFVGPIPPGLHLDHLCRNRRCVNPVHLEPVTPRENTLRGVGATARHARATHCPQGHLYDDANTWRSAVGHRQCRTCNRHRAQARAYSLTYSR